jgi:hypothetical protein
MDGYNWDTTYHYLWLEIHTEIREKKPVREAGAGRAMVQ